MNMGMNPMQMLQTLMQGGKNPKQMIMNLVGNKNPIFNNLIQMADKGDNKGLEQFAENIYKEKFPNRNFKDDFMQFKSNVGNQNK